MTEKTSAQVCIAVKVFSLGVCLVITERIIHLVLEHILQYILSIFLTTFRSFSVAKLKLCALFKSNSNTSLKIVYAHFYKLNIA
jgi:hypothetical protein